MTSVRRVEGIAERAEPAAAADFDRLLELQEEMRRRCPPARPEPERCPEPCRVPDSRPYQPKGQDWRPPQPRSS